MAPDGAVMGQIWPWWPNADRDQRRRTPAGLRCPVCLTDLVWQSFDMRRRSELGTWVDAVGHCPTHGKWDVIIRPSAGNPNRNPHQ